MTAVLNNGQTVEELRSDNDALRDQLHEAEETLDAIRHGEVDSLIAQTPAGPRVFTLVDAYAPYRTFVDEMQHGAATLSAGGTVLYCNRSLPALLRTPTEQVVGSAWSTFVADESGDASKRLLARAVAENACAEFTLRAADGTLVPVSISASPPPVKGTGEICLVITDLTERRNAEESARKLTAIVQSTEAGFLRRTRNRLLGGAELPRSAARCYGVAILGVALGFVARWMLWPLLGSQTPFLIHWPAVIAASWYGGFRPGLLATVLTAAGTWFFTLEPPWSLMISDPADIFGLALFLLLGAGLSLLMEYAQKAVHTRLMTDASERALRAAGLYHRSLIEASLDPLVTIGADGKITDVNAATENATGRTREQLIGTDFADYFTEPDKARQGYQQVFREGSVRDYPLEIRRRDGHLTPMLYNASVYRDEAGEAIGVFAAARDITARKKAEDQVRALNAELEQRVHERTAQLEAANKELESFAYSVSHDLRAPLRAIDGFSLALAEDCKDRLDDQGRDYLERVRAGSQKMARLIDDILHLSRTTRAALECETVNLADLARSVLAELREQEPGREIEVVIGETNPVHADPRLMRVVLQNLLGNAWKFTSKRENPRIEFGCRKEGEECTFFVKDNGAGFDMAHAANLFGAFQRLHATDEFPGNGIGLATVKRIINKHGGRIWAEAAVNQGATFYFSLPEKGKRSIHG